MLNIIIGKNGLSEKIYKAAYGKYLEGISSYIFTPGKAKSIAEKEYIKINKLNGIIGVSICSFGRYISKSIEDLNYDLNKKVLPAEGKKLAIKKEIIKSADSFKIFKDVSVKESYISEVTRYFEKFKKEDMDFDKVLKDENISEFLKGKIKEIYEVYTNVNKSMSQKFVDSVDEIDVYIDNVPEESNKEYFFDGYTSYTSKELSAIFAMLKKGYNISISIAFDEKYINENDSGIFEEPYITYLKLIELAKEKDVAYSVEKLEKKEGNLESDIQHLKDNIFCSLASKYTGEVKNIGLKTYKNIYDEIENIAREIYGKVYNEGARYSDFSIYTNDFMGYENAIKKTFSEYAIPIYLNTKNMLRNNIVSIYLKEILNIVLGKDLKMEQVILLLKTGFMGESRDDIAYFEKYICEFGAKIESLQKEYIINNKEGSYEEIYNLEKINKIRENVLARIADLSESLIACKTSKEYTREIYNHILKNNIAEIYLKLQVEGENISSKMLQKIYDVMDEICAVNSLAEVTLEEYISDFSFLIDSAEISNSEEYLDQVTICDVNQNMAENKACIYVIGCVENGLPSNIKEDNIFKDMEIDYLKSIGINSLENSYQLEKKELLNIYLLVNSTLKSISFTMPASKVTGESLRPGHIIQSIKALFNIQLIGDISETNIESVLKIDETNISKKVAFKKMLEGFVSLDSLSAKDIEKVYSLYKYFENSKEYVKVLGYKREDQNLSKETLDSIYKENITSSVSKLEKFVSCPFSYLVNYVLNLKEKKEYKVQGKDTGDILHKVIDKFSNILTAKSLKWHEIIPLELEGKFVSKNVDKISEEIFESDYFKFENSSRYIYLKNKVKESMVKAILGISESFNSSQFTPLGYEIKFGKGELFSPIELKLKNGKTICFTGKIDRVDSAKINDKTYIRIVDYKSSNKVLTLENIKEGLSLQLMSYMSAILENKEKISAGGEVLPAAISYLTITSKVVSMSSYEKDENKIKKKIIETLKNRGIYIKDVEVLDQMDRNYKDASKSYIDVGAKISPKKSLEEEAFLLECKNIQETLMKISEDITLGIVKIAPKKINKKLPCEYCAYKNMCRKTIRG